MESLKEHVHREASKSQLRLSLQQIKVNDAKLRVKESDGMKRRQGFLEKKCVSTSLRLEQSVVTTLLNLHTDRKTGEYVCGLIRLRRRYERERKYGEINSELRKT